MINVGSLTYIEKMLEEIVGQMNGMNEKMELLLVKSFPELADKSKEGGGK